MYGEYHKTKKGTQARVRHLEIHDPKNATRSYTTQFVDSMKGFGNEIARSNEALAEALKKSLDEKKSHL